MNHYQDVKPMGERRFRRCRVKVIGGTRERGAWVPMERAKVGDEIALQFSDEAEGWVKYTIVWLDTLVVNGAVLPYCTDIDYEQIDEDA